MDEDSIGGKWRKIVIYNVYVPLKYDGGGSTTVRRQLQNSLNDKGVLREQRDHIYRQLKEDIEDKVEDGNQILVGGDFNDTLGEK